MTSPRVRTIPANPQGRDFVVGDVHGCFRTLGRALVELRFDPDRDRLFGVGDLVNRGPHSIEAIDWLEHRFEAVTLGNHDRSALRCLEAALRQCNARPEEDWIRALKRSDYPRWLAALRQMPLALTIDTPPRPRRRRTRRTAGSRLDACHKRAPSDARTDSKNQVVSGRESGQRDIDVRQICSGAVG